MSDSRVRALAFHLPQFHPFPENDFIWGRGFTEWTNVTKARSLFRGHYQPQLPADLGFYDLRLPEARAAQADLAREYGIYGFCYYHYWLHGHRLMTRPIDDILASGQPDFPFCFCWANESWTKKWDGQEQNVIRQDYSTADDKAHIQWLLKAFRDPRYIRVADKPLFLVYSTRNIPDVAATLGLWREEARRSAGLDLYLCRVESFHYEHNDPAKLGFDAAVEFQPDWMNMPPRLPGRSGSLAFEQHKVYEYAGLAENMLSKPKPPYKRFPGITPGWDNSPRRLEGATIIKGATPDRYRRWLKKLLRNFQPYSAEENFIFINAWNEWAEGGNHLEPCRKWGRAFLEATRESLSGARAQFPSPAGEIPPILKEQQAPPSPRAVSQLDMAALFHWLGDVTLSALEREEGERALSGKLERVGFHTHLYNLASYFATQGKRGEAAALFSAVRALTENIRPELAGKASFKLAQLTADPGERQRHLGDCLRLLPGHDAARRELRSFGQPEGEILGHGAASTSGKPVLAVVCPQIGVASETFIRKHIQRLAPQRTVVLTGKVLDESWFSGPVKIIPIKMGRYRFDPAMATEVLNFLKENVVTHILCEFGCIGGAVIELNESSLQLPVFVHFFGQDASEFLNKPDLVAFYRWMEPRTKAVMVVAGSMKTRLIDIGIPSEKISIVHAGADVPEVVLAAPEREPCRILAVSRLVPKKGLFHLLNAFELAASVIGSLSLDIVGDGPLRTELEQFIELHGLRSRVTLHGQQPHARVLEMVDESSIFIQHSITDPETGNREGMPVIILEAAAHGIPIVATRHEGIPEAVAHGQTGFLVEEGDWQSMAAFILKLAGDSALRKKMGLAGREKMRRDGFTTQTTVDQLRELMGFPADAFTA